MKLLLFDIDGTLLLSGGVGMVALKRACSEVFGRDMTDCPIHPHGKTDPAIVRELVLMAGAEGPIEPRLGEVYQKYLVFLEAALASGNDFKVLKGVRSALQRFSQHPEVVLGLATGNLEEGARLKLDKAKLRRYFSFGGFGSDSENRTEIIQTGIRRAERFLQGQTASRLVLIGDTPLDIQHGRQAGAETVGVATGIYLAEDLAACGADLVLSSLEEVGDLLEFLELAEKDWAV